MDTIVTGFSSAFIDFIVTGPFGEPLLISFFDRSAQVVRSVGSSLVMTGTFDFQKRTMKNDRKFIVNYSNITKGRERFTHGLAVAVNIQSEYLVTTEEDLLHDLYYFLMNRFDFPILESWMPEILKMMRESSYLYEGSTGKIYGNDGHVVTKEGREILLCDLRIFKVDMQEEQLKELLSSLLAMGRICISRISQKKLQIASMDDYFSNYGKSIVDNLQKILHPVSDLNGEIDRICLHTMRLYPQQAAMVNGVYEYLCKKKPYVFFCMGTGSGKTIQAAAAAEMFLLGNG